MKTWQKLKNNPALWDKLFVRERVFGNIRRFFQEKKFHDVETPILLENPPAESYVDVFTTTLLNRQKKKKTVYLATSPETALKKLLVAGIGNCFSITKSFRNGETGSATHLPEFSILEWYRVGATYEDIMKDCEDLVMFLVSQTRTEKTIQYQGKEIAITPPWERITVSEAFSRWAHIDLNEFLDEKKARSIAEKKGYRVNANNTWEELYDQIYLNEIEKHLGVTKPTIIYDFPGKMAALSKKKKSDPRFAERFEFYIGNLELGDCYSELTNAKEQEDRFKKECAQIKRLHKTSYDYDHDFITALRLGLPECAGIAVGLDRLIMLLSDAPTIDDTTFFPANELY